MKTNKELIDNVEDVDRLVQLAQELLDGGTSEGRTRANVLTRSGIVLLAGYLEGFIREVIIEFVESVNELKAPLKVLPERMLLVAIESVAAECRGSPDRLSELRNAVSGNHTQSLNAKLYSKTGGSPTVDTIESLFASVGVPDVIDVLTQRDFQTHTFYAESQASSRVIQELDSRLSGLGPGEVSALKTEIIGMIDRNWPPRKKRREVGYVYCIQQLLKKRNRIAHGEGREPITPLELGQFRDQVVALSAGLSAMLDDRLGSIRQAVATVDEVI